MTDQWFKVAAPGTPGVAAKFFGAQDLGGLPRVDLSLL
jgi:hypothetical protein